LKEARIFIEWDESVFGSPRIGLPGKIYTTSSQMQIVDGRNNFLNFRANVAKFVAAKAAETHKSQGAACK
jgi:hypothetical protein